jgi:hypothetical protein
MVFPLFQIVIFLFSESYSIEFRTKFISDEEY